MSILYPSFNCQQATLLIERRADEILPAQTRALLWAHLQLCPNCHRYEYQSRFIAQLAKAAAESQTATVTLPAEARERLQLLLEAKTGSLPLE